MRTNSVENEDIYRGELQHHRKSTPTQTIFFAGRPGCRRSAHRLQRAMKLVPW
jgi:hypothetical protein